MVGRGEQGAARPAISAPTGGPHLDLVHLRLKPGSKSDFWIAETWPTYLDTYTYTTCTRVTFSLPGFVQALATAAAAPPARAESTTIEKQNRTNSYLVSGVSYHTYAIV